MTMTIVQVVTGIDRSQFDEVSKYLNPKETTPGHILHAAMEMADGSVQMVDAFEDDASMQRAGVERIFPAFEKAGLLGKLISDRPPEAATAFEFVLAGS